MLTIATARINIEGGVGSQVLYTHIPRYTPSVFMGGMVS